MSISTQRTDTKTERDMRSTSPSAPKDKAPQKSKVEARSAKRENSKRTATPTLDPARGDRMDAQEDRQKRKRRREEHDRLKGVNGRFELHGSLSNMIRRAEDLFGEASDLERRLHVPLPEESDIPAEELESLERLHEKRLADMVSSVCKKILSAIMANKWSWPFNNPVDVGMYPDYAEKVEQAMDFGTIKRNLEGGVYRHPEQFVEHVRLVFRNARSYNKPGSDVHVMAKTLQEKFEDRYAASIVPRLVEAQKQREADKIELRRRMAEQKALGGRELADGECAAIIQSIDSLLADIDLEKIKAAAACGPVDRAEKEALVARFREMDEGVLGRALGIIFHHYPGVKGANEVAFDIETLDSLCLRQVLSYVKGVEEKGARAGARWPPNAFVTGCLDGSRKQ